MPIHVESISAEQVKLVLVKRESHFFDAKAKEIAPSKLTKHLSALANADGGELYVGVEEADGQLGWNGFESVEVTCPQ